MPYPKRPFAAAAFGVLLALGLAASCGKSGRQSVSVDRRSAPSSASWTVASSPKDVIVHVEGHVSRESLNAAIDDLILSEPRRALELGIQGATLSPDGTGIVVTLKDGTDAAVRAVLGIIKRRLVVACVAIRDSAGLEVGVPPPSASGVDGVAACPGR